MDKEPSEASDVPARTWTHTPQVLLSLLQVYLPASTAAADKESLAALRDSGLIREHRHMPGSYCTTPMGDAHVAQLCAVALPAVQYVDARSGRKIPELPEQLFIVRNRPH